MKNIARPVHAYRVPLPSEEQVTSPFRGLNPFEFENADLFFGRARAIADCMERLEQQAANGKAFLLIYGMSGSGKSSLLRAGLLPSIIRPGAVAGINLGAAVWSARRRGPIRSHRWLPGCLAKTPCLSLLANRQRWLNSAGLPRIVLWHSYARRTPRRRPPQVRFRPNSD